MHYTILTHGTASFYDLGLGLARGFAELGIPCRVAGRFIRLVAHRVGRRRSVCIGIGSWRSLPFIYDQPRSVGATVVPWLDSGERPVDPIPSGAVSHLLPPHAPAIVTGFIDIGSRWRSTAQYVALGEQLLQLGLPTVLYLDESLTVDAPPQTTVIPTRFADCWLAGRVPKGIRLPAGANADKDTIDYLILQHQKSRWSRCLWALRSRSRGVD